jgi:LmbE family N-acetylglucosaminyl deacetylase
MPSLPVIKPNADTLNLLQRLSTAGTVLHVGAHPDDEDVGLVAFLARHHHLRFVYWSATRGEGGENRIGPYRGDALGIYRTWESLSAREIDGGEAMFGPFYDFGFSKSGEETLRKWGRAALVREIVRAIRLVQPLIVISRWTGGAQDGHGHHLAVGMVIQEAFDAAGDPEHFLELNLPAWQPRKLFCSTSGDWEPGVNMPIGKLVPAYEQDGYVRVNTGLFDHDAGRTYQEQAWIGFNSHKTQAMGFAPAPGDFYYYYALCKCLVPQISHEQDLFAGLDNTLAGLAAYPGGLPELSEPLKKICKQVIEAVERFRADAPIEAAGCVIAGLHEIRVLQQQLSQSSCTNNTWALARYLHRTEAEFEWAAAHCMGLRLECLSDDARVCPGQEFVLQAHLWNQEGIDFERPIFALHMPDGWLANPSEPPEAQVVQNHFSRAFRVRVAETAAMTIPYWLRNEHGPYSYTWENTPADGLPFGFDAVEVSCQVQVSGQSIHLHAPAVLREAFTGGFRELPVAVVPPISIHPHEQQVFLPVLPEEVRLELSVILRSNSEHAEVSGCLKLVTPLGWQVNPERIEISLGKTGDAKTIRLSITIPPDPTAGRYLLQYMVQVDGRDYAALLEPVRMVAPGLPGFPDETNCIQEEFITVPAEIKVDLIEVEFIQDLKYAFVKGSEEHMIESLSHFPLEFQLLDDDALGYADLRQFDAVIIGPDAYLVRDALCKNASRLLEYTASGGTLIVFRQGYAYQGCNFAPYLIRFHEPNDEVTDEAAPVTRLHPEHPLLSQPNTISDADFTQWVNSRGNFFIGEWDAHYEALLSCSDPGEAPRCGGFLVAPYGRGNFLYCAYSLCAQLPAGVPGAFRLLANILALPRQRDLMYAQWLKRASFFATLDHAELLKLARIAIEKTEKDGAYLCHEGETAERIFFIVSGHVEVTQRVQDNRLITCAGPGETIGELSVLAGIPNHVSMRARGEVHLLCIPGIDFLRLMHEHKPLMEQVIQVLAKELIVSGSC